MIVRVKLLLYDVREFDEDKSGFLSVGVDIFKSIIFERATNLLSHGYNE